MKKQIGKIEERIIDFSGRFRGGGGGGGDRGGRAIAVGLRGGIVVVVFISGINRKRRGFGGGGSNVLSGGASGTREAVSQLREVEVSGVTFDGSGGDVVSSGGHFWSGKCPQPNSGFLLGFSDF